VFVELLARSGDFEVRTATTGYDAGMQTESFRPDLILLDYMLPDVNGNVVCRELRKRADFNSTKIIFISGVVGRDEIARLKEEGADDFIAKPFDLTAVLSKVRAMLGVAGA
jgi:DNA-binding response OmpR family regulator